MIENITFLNSSWAWQIIGAGMVLWLVCIWKEWELFGQRKFWTRIVGALLGISSLILIALQPAQPVLDTKTKTVVLTKGYNKKQLDSLKKRYKKLKTFAYQPNQPIFENIHTSDTVFVVGEGIEPYDFWQLEDYKARYIRSEIPSGVVKYKYTRNSTVGNSFVFSGWYNRPKSGNQLFIEGPAGNKLDSVVLMSDTKQFQLSTNLKATGNYIFSLVEKDSLGSIRSRDPIPVRVAPRKKLKILIVNSFPTFETKYLKNYLAEMGHQVLVKSRITKGRYKFEYFNTDKKRFGSFSKENLMPFDLLVIDAGTAQNLGRNAQMVLENSVKENGLGLFIQPDQSFFRSSTHIGSFQFIKQKGIETHIDEIQKVKISKHPFLFKKDFRLQSIHKNSNEQILSAYMYMGKGKIGTMVLENTYELFLDSNTKEYQWLWSQIIDAISKREITDINWNENSILAIQDQPYSFSLETTMSKPMVVGEEGYTVAMRRDIDISNRWYGKTYPRKLGWEKVYLQQDTTDALTYFVTDTTTWKSKYTYDKILENERAFTISYHQDNTNRIVPQEPINPIALYIFFLACIAYVWLAPKIDKD